MRDLIERVRAAVTTGGIQKVDLAAEAQLHRNSLSGLEQDAWDPRVSTLGKLLDAIDRIQARRAV